MMKKTLTVFTPTYNRAHTLPRTYESLCRQTCHDFEWLVVDDGSTDGTDALVEQWMSEGRIAMRYIRQENQGMHGAHNTAYAHISSPLNVCIDSDDMLTDKAVESILRTWREQADEHTAGLVGLDVDMATRQVIGTPFPEGVNRLHMTDYYNRMKGRGDKKYVLRTDLVKKYPPYPLFCGEKYVNLATLYAFIDIDYTWIVLNEPLQWSIIRLTARATTCTASTGTTHAASCITAWPTCSTHAFRCGANSWPTCTTYRRHCGLASGGLCNAPPCPSSPCWPLSPASCFIYIYGVK